VLQNKTPGSLKVYSKRYDAPVCALFAFPQRVFMSSAPRLFALAFASLKKKSLKITPVVNASEQAMGS